MCPLLLLSAFGVSRSVAWPPLRLTGDERAREDSAVTAPREEDAGLDPTTLAAELLEIAAPAAGPRSSDRGGKGRDVAARPSSARPLLPQAATRKLSLILSGASRYPAAPQASDPRTVGGGTLFAGTEWVFSTPPAAARRIAEEDSVASSPQETSGKSEPGANSTTTASEVTTTTEKSRLDVLESESQEVEPAEDYAYVSKVIAIVFTSLVCMACVHRHYEQGRNRSRRQLTYSDTSTSTSSNFLPYSDAMNVVGRASEAPESSQETNGPAIPPQEGPEESARGGIRWQSPDGVAGKKQKPAATKKSTTALATGSAIFHAFFSGGQRRGRGDETFEERHQDDDRDD